MADISAMDPIFTGAEGPLEFEDRKDSLVGKIASDVARAISEGRLAPGDELNSVDLASRYGTSRTPVREALMLLEKEGLVEIPPRRRPRVARIDLKEIEDLYAIREVLNDLVIRQFIANARSAEIEGMRFICEEMRVAARGGDQRRFRDRRVALFIYWEAHCGNESLRQLLRRSKMRLSVTRLAREYPEDVEQMLEDNLRLASACEARDVDLATALIRSMTRQGRDMVMAEARRLGAH
jgi:DNA-binding GntR family transcriptional regulator